MDTHTKVLIYDFGGQYAHLISRRVRELGYEPKIVGTSFTAEDMAREGGVAGIVLSGGARSVYERTAPRVDPGIFDANIPILGVCYGHQLIAHMLGGNVSQGAKGEYGPAMLTVGKVLLQFSGITKKSLVWMNHRDTVTVVPKGFSITAATPLTPVAAFAHAARRIWGVQFHPEVTHTEYGTRLLKNFLRAVGGATHQKRDIVGECIDEARRTIGGRRTIVGLSGGVDSSVAAILVARAIGRNLLAVFVDTGLMRIGEAREIRKTFSAFPLRLRIIHAGSRYFKALKGVTDPEKKRKVIGKIFIDIFNEEAKKFRADVLVQGTIYSDRIESGLTEHSSRIKSHHNVGGLPKNMKLEVYEPLRNMYKDEVRALGRMLGLPDAITARQVFPGPGFGVRILGEVTTEKASIVQRADGIIQEELQKAGLLRRIWMAFPVLLPILSVGVQGDERTYKYPLVLRVVESRDAMTANFFRVPYPVMEKISTRITNEVREVNRVVYDVSNKPPATMEWE